MSYWLGKHSVGETPLGVASRHQVAVTPEPDGATFGWLVECRCGWQARVPRLSDVEQVKNICAGTAQNHFDKHLLETINVEVLWPSSLVTSEVLQEKDSLLPEQLSGEPSPDQQGQQPDIRQEKKSAESSPVDSTKEDSQSLPQSTTSQTSEVKTPPTPSSSTDSQGSPTQNQEGEKK